MDLYLLVLPVVLGVHSVLTCQMECQETDAWYKCDCIDECRDIVYHQSQNTTFTWDEAKNVCDNDLGSTLLTIENVEENRRIAELISKRSIIRSYMGLVCDGDISSCLDGRFRWEGKNQKWNYSNFGKTHSGTIGVVDENGYWTLADPRTKLSFICKLVKHMGLSMEGKETTTCYTASTTTLPRDAMSKSSTITNVLIGGAVFLWLMITTIVIIIIYKRRHNNGHIIDAKRTDKVDIYEDVDNDLNTGGASHDSKSSHTVIYSNTELQTNAVHKNEEEEEEGCSRQDTIEHMRTPGEHHGNQTQTGDTMQQSDAVYAVPNKTTHEVLLVDNDLYAPGNLD